MLLTLSSQRKFQIKASCWIFSMTWRYVHIYAQRCVVSSSHFIYFYYFYSYTTVEFYFCVSLFLCDENYCCSDKHLWLILLVNITCLCNLAVTLSQTPFTLHVHTPEIQSRGPYILIQIHISRTSDFTHCRL